MLLDPLTLVLPAEVLVLADTPLPPLLLLSTFGGSSESPRRDPPTSGFKPFPAPVPLEARPSDALAPPVAMLPPLAVSPLALPVTAAAESMLVEAATDATAHVIESSVTDLWLAPTWYPYCGRDGPGTCFKGAPLASTRGRGSHAIVSAISTSSTPLLLGLATAAEPPALPC